LQNIARTGEDGCIHPVGASSTMQSFEVTEDFRKRMDLAGYEWKPVNGECIGNNPTGDFRYPVEQQALFDLLMAQSIRNPDETNLKEEITRMLKAPQFDIRSPK